MSRESGRGHHPGEDLSSGATFAKAHMVADKFREFRATSLAIEHKTSVLVLLFIIALMGVLAYRATPERVIPGDGDPNDCYQHNISGCVSSGCREPSHADS